MSALEGREQSLPNRNAIIVKGDDPGSCVREAFAIKPITRRNVGKCTI